MRSRLNWLLILLPIVAFLRYGTENHEALLFVLSALSIIPLARFLSEATSQLATRTGPTLGALLNVTFGNAGELFVSFFALREGLVSVVKASLSGSILANLLLFLGASMLAGGLRNRTLSFNSLAARTRSTMLTLAAIAMILPAAYHYVAPKISGAHEFDLSSEFAVILLITYGCSLLFILRTHHDLLVSPCNSREEHGESWSLKQGLLILALSSVLIGWMSEILADSIQPAAKTLGLSNVFVGIVILAIAGNTAESMAAIRAAMEDRMDLSVGISLGSSIQIALFVAPALVLLSHFVGPKPMDLVFSPLEIVALVLAMAITGQIAGDGDSNWLEGVQLIAVYLMLAVMFYLLPAT